MIYLGDFLKLEWFKKVKSWQKQQSNSKIHQKPQNSLSQRYAKMLKILKTIDIFGSSIQLSFRHKYQHKTCCGGIFTVFLVLIFCSSFWFLGRDSIFRLNPTISNISNEDESYPFPISDTSFPIAFGLRQKQSLKFLNQEQFGFSFSVFVENTSISNDSLNVQETEILLQECSTQSSDDISSEFLSFLSKKDLTNLFCLNNQNTQLKASSLETSKVIVKLNACSLTSIDCLENYFSLEDLILEAVFVDHMQSFTNYEHPFKGFVKTITASPSAGLKKVLSLVFSEVQLVTDDSYAFSDSSFSFQQNLAFSTQSLDFSTVQSSEINPVILEMQLEIEQHQISYLRSYKKLSNVLAEIGGLSRVLMFIFALVVVPFAKLDFQTSLMNEIFYFEDEHNQKQQQKNNNNNTQYLQKSPEKLHLNSRKTNYLPGQIEKKEEKSNNNINLKSTQGKPICLQLPERITKLQKKGKAERESQTNQACQNQEQINEEKEVSKTEQLKENEVKARISQEVQDTIKNSLKNIDKADSDVSKGSSAVAKGQKKDSEIVDERFISQMLHTYSANQDPDSAKLRKKKVLRNFGNNYFKQIFSPKSGGLIFKAYEYVLYYLFPLGEIKKKKRQLEFSLEKINDKLDAVFLINKLLEIDKLKMLMLTEDQLKLFDYMPKPVINNTTCLLGELHPDITNPNFHFRRQTIKLKPTKFPPKPTLDWSLLHQGKIILKRLFRINLFLLFEEKTTLMKAHEAYTAFNKIKDSKADISIIDNKLISTLCPKILNYFESTRKQARFDAQLDNKQSQLLDDPKEKNDQQFFNNITLNQEKNTICLDEFSSLEENTSEIPFKQREDTSPDKTQLKNQLFDEVASESFFRNKLVLTDFSPTKNRMISSGTS